MGAGPVLRAVQHLGERAIEDVVDQRRLAGAGDARHAREGAERDAHVRAREVVLARVVDDERGAVALAALGGQRDGQRAREIAPGERVRIGEDLVRRADRHQVSAELAGAGPEVDHEVRAADGLLVVLDHEHGVAEVAQALEGLQQSPVVALVQADRRLVEDVEHADQAGSDLRG